ncbi:hypothetical protein Tco_0448454 [Tanacetum coccineum]
MAQLKYCDKHNQVGFLLKPTESTGYTEIVDFLRRSKLRYALTHNPPIYDSLVKQFWQTATARTLADGTQQLNATIDSIEYTITEESVRRQLQLADASGINMLQNEEIFAGLQNIGSKSGGWDQFGSNIATALICLSTGRDFNFSKLIFDGMISNLKSKSKFLMYPRFLQMILNIQTENKNLFVPVLLTKKIFGNMKRSFQGIHRPLLPAMLTIDAGQPQPSAAPTPSQPVPTPPPITSTPPPITSTPPPITSTPPPITSTPPPITQSPPTLTQHVQSSSPPPQPSKGPSFEPSYHLSPPPSHEPENQAFRSSEEYEQLRNLMDIVPRSGDTFATPEKSKGSGEAQEEQISPSTLEAAQILTNVASEGFKGSQASWLSYTGEVNAFAEVNTGEEKEEDERAIKKMNEKAIHKEEEKKDDSVHEEVKEEEGSKKRKLGTRRKLKAKRRKHASGLTREDDDLKICLHIAPDEDKTLGYSEDWNLIRWVITTRPKGYILSMTKYWTCFSYCLWKADTYDKGSTFTNVGTEVRMKKKSLWL